MYCQKCGFKISKKDKYCGRCGKALLPNEGLSNHKHEIISSVYEHNLATVFGYRGVDEKIPYKIEEGEPPEKSSSVSLWTQTASYGKKAIITPLSVLNSNEVYPLSLLWFYISIVLFISSFTQVDYIQATFDPSYYFNYEIFNIDFSYTIPLFLMNTIYFLAAYTIFVIIHSVIKLEKRYEKFVFRDYVTLSSLVMIVSILGTFIIHLGLYSFGVVISKLGIAMFLVLPLILAIYYAMSGKTKITPTIIMPVGIVITIIVSLIFISL
ncbi:zinc ribbon domain-containing protein [Salinicoccus luteus]|uniref:zinc ribbon domain-containing protein n=1 Tax=Salinicoccus luteus TaxID=367840 RepID=UPI0004E0C3C7|nr:zinc ribbon domain-containing protein [Salinicoccus luteus]